MEAQGNSDSPAKGDDDQLQVVIVGGGPSGLLLAHYLLSRGNGRFRVRICEHKEDPRGTIKRPLERLRYSIFLCVRGLLAIKGVDGLLPRVYEAGDIIDATYIYKANGQVFVKMERSKMPKFIVERGEEYGSQFVVDRMELSAALLSHLVDRYGDSGLLEVVFERGCASVDMRARTVTLASRDGDGAPLKWSYDVLVGADGVNSVVRNALSRGSWGFDSSITTSFGQVRTMRFKPPLSWQEKTFHVYHSVPGVKEMSSFIIPDNRVHGTIMLVLVWHHHEPPAGFLSIKDGEGMKKFLENHLPMLGDVPEETAAQLLDDRNVTTPRAVKCNRYHDGAAGVVLIGDAAHATYPNIGQGCNAALTDSQVLGRLLLGETVTNENKPADFAVSREPATLSVPQLRAQLPSILARFSALQVRDGHALVDLSYAADSFDKGLKQRMDLKWAIADVLGMMFPRLTSWIPSSPNMLAGLTTRPYAEVWDLHRSSVEHMTRRNDELRAEWRKKEDERLLKEGDKLLKEEERLSKKGDKLLKEGERPLKED